METKYGEVDVWVYVDEDGDYATGEDAGVAAERYGECIAEIDGTRGGRLVQIKVRVPLPTPVVLEAEVTLTEAASVKVA